MADGKLYIIVTDQVPGGQAPVPGVETDKKDKEKEGSLEKFASHKFFNFVESQAKQAINYSVSNIGNFTGNYIEQTHMSEALQGVNFLISLATSAYAGFKLSGGSPYGALIAAGITVASTAINTVQQHYAGLVDASRRNEEAAQLRTRAGLNSTNNGSRGTDQ